MRLWFQRGSCLLHTVAFLRQVIVDKLPTISDVRVVSCPAIVSVSIDIIWDKNQKYRSFQVFHQTDSNTHSAHQRAQDDQLPLFLDRTADLAMIRNARVSTYGPIIERGKPCAITVTMENITYNGLPTGTSQL